MNIKFNFDSFLYAISRLFAPTITIVIFILICTLSPTETWKFLKKQETLSIFVRLLIFVSEVALFGYLYYNHYINNVPKNLDLKSFKTGNLAYDSYWQELQQFVRSTTSTRDKKAKVYQLDTVGGTERFLITISED